MGLYDRDYMRERQGARDRYHAWIEDTRRPVRRRSGWTWRSTAVTTFLIVLGLLVLPQLTIAGRHWRFLFF